MADDRVIPLTQGKLTVIEKAADAWRTRQIDYEHEIAAIDFGPAQLLDEILLNDKNPAAEKYLSDDLEKQLAEARAQAFREAAEIARTFKSAHYPWVKEVQKMIVAALERAAEEKDDTNGTNTIKRSPSNV